MLPTVGNKFVGQITWRDASGREFPGIGLAPEGGFGQSAHPMGIGGGHSACRGFRSGTRYETVQKSLVALSVPFRKQGLSMGEAWIKISLTTPDVSFSILSHIERLKAA